jgi:hypothetical protein
MALLAIPEGVPATAQARTENGTLAIPDVPAAPGQFYRARVRVASALRLAASGTANLKVAGVGGVPSSGVGSVMLNVAVMSDGGTDHLTVYPSDAAKPDATFMRYRSDAWFQNMLPVKVGPDGNIKITNDDESAVTLYVDVHGYTLSSAGATPGLTFHPLKSARIGSITVPANGTATVEPLGKAGIPASGVSDVTFSITARSATTGKLTVYPSGESQPTGTNLDYGLDKWLQNHVWTKLGADGKAIIKNSGSQSLVVAVDATGYFVDSQAPVAGTTLVPLISGRLANGVSVASRATYTHSPLGRAGVPSTGVSAVWINVTTYGTAGHIRPRTSTDTPITHLVTTPGDTTYSGGMPAKLAADGTISLYNDSSGATTLWIDVFGYFKTPSSRCAAGTATAGSGQAPVVPQADPEPFSPTTVMQAAPVTTGDPGSIELAYTDNLGYMLHGRADPSALGSVQWTTVSTIDQQFSGRPALGQQPDGKLHLLGRDTSNNVWTRTETSTWPHEWGAWQNANRPMAGNVELARHDSTLVAFAVDAAGVLWALPQYQPNAAYGEWISLGMSGLSTSGAPVAVPVGDGVQLFALDATGAWQTALYSRGSLSGCATVSGPGFSGTLSAVVHPGNRVQIFARGADGHILTKGQDSSGAFPQDWEQVGDLLAEGSPSAVISPVTRRMEIVVRGRDGQVHNTGETFQGSGAWRPWQDALPDTRVPATDPTAFTYTSSNGTAWAYLFRTQSNALGLYPVFESVEGVAARSAIAPPKFTAKEMTKPPSTRR